MNKNLVIAFLIGIILTLIAVNYLPKFDIKIEFPEEKEIVQSEQEPVDEEKLISDSVSKKNEKNEIFFAGQNVTEDELQSILTEKEDEVRGASNIKEFLPPQDKYKDLEKDQLNYSNPIEVKKPDDPFDKPNRPTPIKEPTVPDVNIPEPERPEMSAESIERQEFGGPHFGSFAASTDADVLPIIKVPPQYPRSAIQKCIEGWVLLEFTITPSGAVINPVVLDAEPLDIFNRSASSAIAKWKYKPRIVDGKAVAQKGVTHVISYQLGPQGCQKRTKLSDLRQPEFIEPIEPKIIDPGFNIETMPKRITKEVKGKITGSEDKCVSWTKGKCVEIQTNYEERLRVYNTNCNTDPFIKYNEPYIYPKRAIQRGIEGWVLVEYTVTKNGDVRDPMVVDADPPGIFNRSALRKFVKDKYLPAKKNCKKISAKVQRLATYSLNDK